MKFGYSRILVRTCRKYAQIFFLAWNAMCCLTVTPKTDIYTKLRQQKRYRVMDNQTYSATNISKRFALFFPWQNGNFWIHCSIRRSCHAAESIPFRESRILLVIVNSQYQQLNSMQVLSTFICTFYFFFLPRSIIPMELLINWELHLQTLGHRSYLQDTALRKFKRKLFAPYMSSTSRCKVHDFAFQMIRMYILCLCSGYVYLKRGKTSMK